MKDSIIKNQMIFSNKIRSEELNAYGCIVVLIMRLLNKHLFSGKNIWIYAFSLICTKIVFTVCGLYIGFFFKKGFARKEKNV